MTTWPKNFPGLGTAPERIAARLNELSGGGLQVKVYAAGELVGAFESFDAVQSGAAHMYHGAEYYWQGKAAAYPFFTTVPFGMTAAEFMGWIDFGGGQALWDELAANFNIKPLQAANTGHQMGGWFKSEINSLEDFKGLKVRMPGLGGQVLRQLGGAAIALPGGEIYQALQSGAIDGTEWVGPWNDLAFGFHREAKHYYGPGFHEPGASLALGINKKLWDELTREEQGMIKSACAEANHLSLAEFTYQNAMALELLKIQHGIEPKSFSDEIYLAMREASSDLIETVRAQDAQTGKIADHFVDALKKMRGWTAISDGPYMRLREL